MADWARLLSECRGDSTAGSNPALPARENRVYQGAVFVRPPVPIEGMVFESRPPRLKDTLRKQVSFFVQPKVPIELISTEEFYLSKS